MVEKSLNERLLAIGIEQKTATNICKNDKLQKRFPEVLDLAGVTECKKAVGALIYQLVTKVPPNQHQFTKVFVDLVVQEKWTRTNQLEAGIEYIKKEQTKHGKTFEVNMKEMEEATGVGVVVTVEQIKEAIDKAFEEAKEQIDAKKHNYPFAKLIARVSEMQPWANKVQVLELINEKKLALLGPGEASGKGRNKMSKEEKATKKTTEDKQEIVQDITDLIGRDVDVGNSKEILAKHNAFTKGKVHTRFPPEPNGYLHIGHAKAIRFNFTVAKHYGGNCYLRFDDTNPCKENQEFIDHIVKNVEWLGFTPYKITASSDYFQELYEAAVELIKRGKAYVCFQNSEDMRRDRMNKVNSPWRDTSVEDNLREFEKMRQGRYDEGVCCLRMKMDMQHVNPCMRDTVAYRIRYTPHPHSGNKWCIYPTYDYTHCMVDSLENITHSLCTLEFEVRRESYYQLLKDLDWYQPCVWEYSRLNITNTVLSKRKCEALVDSGKVTGWDDPRLHTLEGLRRRGYTPSMILEFCKQIGVARKGNENFTSYKKLEYYARQELDKNASRTFGVTDPVLLKIVNFGDVKETEIKAPLFPQDTSKGYRTYTLTDEVYIEKDDFSEVEQGKGFFGLTPNQKVYLRYGPVIELVEVVKDGSGQIDHVKVKVVDFKDKLKGVLHWVSKSHSIDARMNLYSVLFTVEDPAGQARNENRDFLEFVNPNSLIVKENGKLWNMHADIGANDRFQFERVGYFGVDKSSKTAEAGGKIVLNRIVELKEPTEKKVNTSNKK